ncbi:hypothetical protein HanIR_Chr10g0476241 [Helianthus annuus]|nr:hypothetical protein HanIR_Chr10g0476241 [Helianthus annuus]
MCPVEDSQALLKFSNIDCIMSAYCCILINILFDFELVNLLVGGEKTGFTSRGHLI